MVKGELEREDPPAQPPVRPVQVLGQPMASVTWSGWCVLPRRCETQEVDLGVMTHTRKSGRMRSAHVGDRPSAEMDDSAGVSSI